MLTIRIHNLKVTSISNLGSLNIGRAILCNNQASSYSVDGNGEDNSEDEAASGVGASAQTASASAASAADT